jgi:hypothetical protein
MIQLAGHHHDLPAVMGLVGYEIRQYMADIKRQLRHT